MLTSENSKRIAKNTLLLYFRMLFLMVISLYTSRIILNALGVEDYGIYNVVGGIVTMFSVLSGSLSAAISRFITYEIGTGNKENLKKIFSSSVTIQISIALLVIILSETIGLWFLNTKLVIPVERLVAANWCYQFSIITFAVGLISVPYNAFIIAHEKMSAFAYISILEVVGKLVVAFCIAITPIDRLIFYAMMLAVIAVIIRLLYSWYCKKNFEGCEYHFIYNRGLLKQMFGFAGWNLFGSAAFVLKDQGINIILNLFFGAAINAARGVSIQVSHAVYGFVQNFITAMTPQITKSYAVGNYEYMNSLVERGSRFSFFLLLIFSTPLIVETPIIMQIWLKNVPDYTVIFVRIVLLTSLFDALSAPVQYAAHATGHIKLYQIVIGTTLLLSFPISYIAYKLGSPPVTAFFIVLFLSAVAFILRLFILKRLYPFDLKFYIKSIIMKCGIVTFLCYLFTICIQHTMDEGIKRLSIVTISSFISSSLLVFFVGCTAKERNMIFSELKNKIKKY